jgi:hypothetical protein
MGPWEGEGESTFGSLFSWSVPEALGLRRSSEEPGANSAPRQFQGDSEDGKRIGATSTLYDAQGRKIATTKKRMGDGVVTYRTRTRRTRGNPSWRPAKPANGQRTHPHE